TNNLGELLARSASPPTPPIGRGGRTRTPTAGSRRDGLRSHPPTTFRWRRRSRLPPRGRDIWDRHLSRRPREREPSCRGTSPSLRRANHDEQDRRCPSLARIALPSLATTLRLHISRNCAANSAERERNAVLKGEG